MQFRNREEAASLLAERLKRYRGTRPVVLGIPRGGVPMAAIVAARLDAELDVMLVHKLRAPFQPELAVGSIDESGRVYLAPFAEDLAIEARALDAEKREQLATIRQRRARYTAARAPVELAGRTVILVDDGLATGSTAIAAIRSARAQRAGRIVVAVGVAPPETVTRLRTEADEVVCLHAPPRFGAVGEFFDDFSEVTDADVIRLLAASVSSPQAPNSPALTDITAPSRSRAASAGPGDRS
jgi:predicted phosphoribosyltransferase